MLNRTPLYDAHLSLGAKMVDFASWQMPVLYKGIIEEHLAVRQSAGIFDIGHMGQIELDDLMAIQELTTNDAEKLEIGQAQYSFICRDDGGIIDDLLIYRLENKYLVVTNAINANVVYEKFLSKNSYAKLLYDSKTSIAIQGPKSEEALQKITDFNLSSLKHRQAVSLKLLNEQCLVSRSGYSGEDGFEIFLNNEDVSGIWDALVKEKVIPCGLGARDTLRLEAGLPLYGHELSLDVSPFEAGLSKAVKFDKQDYIGKKALLKIQEKGAQTKLVGFEVMDKAIPRQGYKITLDAKDIGFVTSGTYSPTLKKSIGMAYIKADLSEGAGLKIKIRDNHYPIQIVKLPFYKRVKNDIQPSPIIIFQDDLLSTPLPEGEKIA